MKYSEEIIAEYKTLMKRDYDHKVTDDEAQLELNSLVKVLFGCAGSDSSLCTERYRS